MWNEEYSEQNSVQLHINSLLFHVYDLENINFVPTPRTCLKVSTFGSVVKLPSSYIYWLYYFGKGLWPERGW